MTCIDFNSVVPCFRHFLKGRMHVHRKDRVRAGHGASPAAAISNLCRALPRRLQGQDPFSCQDHFRVMAFAQMSQRESLRDIEICLRAMRRSCITWASAARSPGTIFPTRTRYETGASTPTSLKFSSRTPGRLYCGRELRRNVERADTLCAGRLDNRSLPFRVPVGTISPYESRDQACIHLSTFAATYPPLSMCQMASYTMSTSWISYFWRPAHSTSWTAATWTTNASTGSTKPWPSSSFEQRRIRVSVVSALIP